MEGLRAAAPGLVIAISAIGGLFLGLVGAFGTGNMPLGPRLLYWVPICAMGGGLAAMLGRLRQLLPHGSGHPLLELGAFVVLLSLPLTGAIWLITALAFHHDLSPGQLPLLFVQVLLITLAMTALNSLIHRPRPQVAARGNEPVRFLERLPPPLRGAEIYAVESEDHYLRVHTSRGSELILLRLSDAVAELEGIEGGQTHRSWWVARSAIDAVKRADGRATLTLKSGIQAPVSRAYARGLREAGWF